jgi:dihydrodipicolinate synthase/N-acetylneuraminate lyase
MKTINGIIPIVAAVFHDNGEVDLEGFGKLIRHLTKTGASALTLFGLATEFYKLTDEEKNAMMEVLLAETTRLPDVAGVISITHHSWEVAVLQAKQAEKSGADALMLLPPYFLSPSPEAILHHMRKVAQSVSIPIIVQYAPNQTGVRLGPEVFVQLQKDCPNACFVKVETQPPGRYASILHEQSGGQIQTLIGYAGVQMPDVLERGSVGIQPGCSFTEIYVELFRLYQAGNKTEMTILFQRLLPYISYWMQGVELIIKAEKRILERRGIISSSYCRYPQYVLDTKEEQMIDNFCEDFQDLLKG